MDHHAGRLVDHDQVLIFIDNDQSNRLGFRRGGGVGGNLDSGGLTGFDPVRGVGYRRAVESHQAGLDQTFDPAARQFGQANGQPFVETVAGLVGRGRDRGENTSGIGHGRIIADPAGGGDRGNER